MFFFLYFCESIAVISLLPFESLVLCKLQIALAA